jgi:DNA invertase Pin-like site-specific DNA recombinase
MSAVTVGRSRPLSEKIAGVHLSRLAVVYVRQSTLQQLERHQESTRLQYGLVERAWSLGWERNQIEVIDDDLGKSGSSVEGREGFQRLLSEVALDHVGIVLGIEMSRLARSCRDWYQLLEVCGLFGTLIGDLDGVYDPTDYNDRLLLGLKGTMSEAELHVLKQRLLAGKRAKAARGELGVLVPIGYVRLPSGEVVKDPDEQAQAVVALIFEQFARCSTINGVLQYLARHHIELPCRVHSGNERGSLQWRAPSRATLSTMLHNPIYAGAYVYGRRRTDPRRQQPGRPSTGRCVVATGEWQVLLKDRLPAYISWAQFEANVRQIKANLAQVKGTIRHGPSLLAGLVVCGRCGLRMATQYRTNGHDLRYCCITMAAEYAQPPCQSLVGRILDEWVGQQVLAALEPAALDVSLKAIEDVELNARDCIGTGSSAWSELAMRLSEHNGNTTPSSRRTAWWRAPWSASGRQRCRPKSSCKPSMLASRPDNLPRSTTLSAKPFADLLPTFRRCGMRRQLHRLIVKPSSGSWLIGSW